MRLTARCPIFFVLFLTTLSFAHAEPAAQTLRLVTPGEVTSGSLLLASTEPGRFVEAPRLATDVQISVSGPIIRTKVTQRFENPGDGWVEGIYVFPLPDQSAVDTLRMQIGNRFIEGEIQEKQRAREIYEQAKAEGRKASLMEQERPNIFTNSVANIGPGETVIIQIEYQETALLDGDKFSLRFPMVVAPRYNPAPTIHLASLDAGGFGYANPVPDRDRIEPPVLNPVFGPVNPVSLSVDLDAGFPLGDVISSYHQMSVTRSDDTHAFLRLTEETIPADRDFELIWQPKAGRAPSAALFTESIAGDHYYLVMITPPAGNNAIIETPREVTFVIDTSGSMGGDSIRQARKSLELALKQLEPTDRFNVIEFNSTITALFETPRPASQQMIRRGLGFVRKLEANGGTEMLPALQAALTSRSQEKRYLRQVIFLTDGAIGNEQQLFDAITRNRQDARVFTVGIGSAPNSFFMSRAAELGQGAFIHIGSVSEVSERMGELFTRLESPVVTNLHTRWPDSSTVEAWPSPLPDVYAGEAVLVAARATTTSGIMTLSGQRGDQPWEVQLDLAQASNRTGISKLWARRKIASLELNRSQPGADHAYLERAILDVALDHSLISRLTSLVAVDKAPSRPAGELLARGEVPLNLPHGWDFGKVFGEGEIQFQREAGITPAIDTSLLQTRPTEAAMAAAPAGQGTAGITLPQGALMSGHKITRGTLLLLVSLLILVALGHQGSTRKGSTG